MDGTTAKRCLRLVANLLSQPWYGPRYFRHLPVWRRGPLDYGLPWYSWAAIDCLASHLTKQMTVFEWGGGGSTLWLSKRVGRVICVESDPGWAERVREELTVQGIANVEVHHHAFDPDDESGFLKSAYLKCVHDVHADAYIVDGLDHRGTLRPHCFAEAMKEAAEGEWVVVDDSWRYRQLRRTPNATVRVLQSVGPCRYGVTSTDIFCRVV